ncbi:MAG: hypothetical protein IJ390_09765 [Lachnospiraceae bacterium]|nr:hypothetical protein [Lachnospiraceae bacterium]
MAKNNKVIKEQAMYQNLQERYEEMHEYLLGLIEDHKRAEEELRYLNDFVHSKKLDEEFRYFREHAHEEYEPDLPFSHLTL